MYEGAFSAGIPFLILLGLAVVAFSIWRYRVKALREKRLREGSYVFPEDRPEWQQKPSAPTHPTMSPDVTADIDFLSSGTGSLIVPARKRKRDRCITVSHTVVARKSSMRTKSTEPADREVKNVAYADLVIFPHWSTCVSVNYLSGWATSRSPLR